LGVGTEAINLVPLRNYKKHQDWESYKDVGLLKLWTPTQFLEFVGVSSEGGL
jgi:hypothetical protein